MFPGFSSMPSGKAPNATLIVRWVSAHVPRILFDAFGVVGVVVRFFTVRNVLVCPVDALLTVSGFVLASSITDAVFAVLDFVARRHRLVSVVDFHDSRRRRARRLVTVVVLIMSPSA